MPAGERLISLRGVERDYHGLRPLRIREFDLHAGESVAVLGLDLAASEVLVNLITAATVPDSGTVEVFGIASTAIADADTWLRHLDRFGILSERVPLLDEMTVAQNLTLPLSLELDQAAAEVHAKVAALAAEVGLEPDQLAAPLTRVSAAERFRVRLGKALASDPTILLAEHPNAAVPAGDVAAMATTLSRIVSRRGVATLVLTADRSFAKAVAPRVLTLNPATGELTAKQGLRRWFPG